MQTNGDIPIKCAVPQYQYASPMALALAQHGTLKCVCWCLAMVGSLFADTVPASPTAHWHGFITS